MIDGEWRANRMRGKTIIIVLALLAIPCLVYAQAGRGGNNSPAIEYTKYVIGHENNKICYFMFFYNDENKVIFLKMDNNQRGQRSYKGFYITSPLERNSFRFYKDYLFVCNVVRGGVFYGKIEDYFAREENADLLPPGTNDSKIRFLENIYQIECMGDKIYCSTGDSRQIYECTFDTRGTLAKTGTPLDSSAGRKNAGYINYFVPVDKPQVNAGWERWKSDLSGFQNSLKSSGSTISDGDLRKYLDVADFDWLAGELKDNQRNKRDEFIQTLADNIRSKNGFDDYIKNAAVYNYNGISIFKPDSVNNNIGSKIDDHNRIEANYKSARENLVSELGADKENDVDRIINANIRSNTINLSRETNLTDAYYRETKKDWDDIVKKVAMEITQPDSVDYKDLVSKDDVYNKEIAKIGDTRKSWTRVIEADGSGFIPLTQRWNGQTWNAERNKYLPANIDYFNNTKFSDSATREQLRSFIAAIYEKSNSSDDEDIKYYVAMLNSVSLVYLNFIETEYKKKNAPSVSLLARIRQDIYNKKNSDERLEKYADVIDSKLYIDQNLTTRKLTGLFTALLTAKKAREADGSKKEIVKYVFAKVYDEVNKYYTDLRKPTLYKNSEKYIPIIYFYNEHGGTGSNTFFTVTGMETLSEGLLTNTSENYPAVPINFDELEGIRQTSFPPNVLLSPVLVDNSSLKIFYRIRGGNVIGYEMDINGGNPAGKLVSASERCRALIPAVSGVFALMESNDGKYNLSRITMGSGGSPQIQMLGNKFGKDDVVYIVRKKDGNVIKEGAVTAGGNGRITAQFRDLSITQNKLPVQIGPDSFAEIGFSGDRFNTNDITIR